MSALREGAVVWITGRPATGKTTLAAELVAALRTCGTPHLWLDSDDLRSVLSLRPEYDDEARNRFYAALGHLAKLGARGGTLVIVSATASRRAFRDSVRAAVRRFIEVFLVCDDARLRARDPKGLYQAADAGRIRFFPGVSSVYEPPLHPELTLDSGHCSPAELAKAVLDELGRR